VTDHASPILRAAVDADVSMLERCARAAYGKYVARIGREPAPIDRVFFEKRL